MHILKYLATKTNDINKTKFVTFLLSNKQSLNNLDILPMDIVYLINKYLN